MLWSLPLRECGLKYEINRIAYKFSKVTPLAGVWIEMSKSKQVNLIPKSLPLRECGLKL